MRILFFGVFLAAALWSTYWLIGANIQETTATKWLEKQQNAGWITKSAAIKLRGFPNRFDTIISDLQITDPDSEWTWSVPEFQLLTLSYKPNHIIAAWPNNQTISTKNENFRIENTKMHASFKFLPNTELELDQFTATIDDITITSDTGFKSHADKIILAARKTEHAEFSYDIALDITGFTVFDEIDKIGISSEEPIALKVSTTAYFNEKLARVAIGTRTHHLKKLDINDVEAMWNGIKIHAEGSLEFDAMGYPTGNLNIHLNNWRDALVTLENTGKMTSEMVRDLKFGLGLFSHFSSGDSKNINIPLTFVNKIIKFGDFTVGDAPRLLY